MKRLALALLFSAPVLPAAAQAPMPPSPPAIAADKQIPLDQALAAAQAALDTCLKLPRPSAATVEVVDLNGLPKVLLSADGDPCDVLVVSQVPVVPGAVIRCRPVGALVMEDDAGGYEKILVVPVDGLHPFYTGIRSYRDLPPIMCEQIAHFFQHYKDLEKGKWVTIVQWLDADGAARLVMEAIARAGEASAAPR